MGATSVAVRLTHHAFTRAAGSGCHLLGHFNREAQGVEAPGHERAASGATELGSRWT